MNPVLSALISSILASLRSRVSLQVEILALRHQLAVYQRANKRPRLKPTDRILWAWLSQIWTGWNHLLTLVKPRTVIEWRKRKLREHWTKVTRSGKTGRPQLSKEVRDLIRDRDAVYGKHFRERVKNLGIKEVPIAPRSPWQSPYVERVIGSIRRDCLDHIIVLNQSHLHRILNRYFDYYHKWRTHRSLNMDCPDERPVHSAYEGKVVEIADVGGLHHHCVRKTA